MLVLSPSAAHEAASDAIRFVLDKAATPESAVLAWMTRIVYAAAEAAAGSGASVVRIHCGADKPYTDRCGNVWSADAFCQGGTAVHTVAAIDGAAPTAADLRAEDIAPDAAGKITVRIVAAGTEEASLQAIAIQ